MKTFCFIVIITLILVGQLFLTASLTLSGNAAKSPYRRAERTAALNALAADPSPANKTAFQEDLKLVSRFVSKQHFLNAAMLMAVWLFIDGVVIYCWVHQGKRKPAA